MLAQATVLSSPYNSEGLRNRRRYGAPCPGYPDVVWRAGAAAISIATATIAVSCGGAAEHYRLSPTRACLVQRGFTTEVDNNWVLKPSQGSLLVIFGKTA